MTSAISRLKVPWTTGAVVLSNLAMRGSFAIPFGMQRDATLPLATFTLLLKNVAAGSRYRIEVASTGNLAEPSANAEATDASTPGTFVDLSITLNYYIPGSSLNNLRIKVRKGTSSIKYLPFETLATAASGTVPAYVLQTTDSIA